MDGNALRSRYRKGDLTRYGERKTYRFSFDLKEHAEIIRLLDLVPETARLTIVSRDTLSYHEHSLASTSDTCLRKTAILLGGFTNSRGHKWASRFCEPFTNSRGTTEPVGPLSEIVASRASPSSDRALSRITRPTMPPPLVKVDSSLVIARLRYHFFLSLLPSFHLFYRYI